MECEQLKRDGPDHRDQGQRKQVVGSLLMRREATTPSRERSLATSVQSLLDELDSHLLAHRPFPIRFWDGSVLEATESDDAVKETVVVRGPVAFADLIWSPDQLGLGRAWVRGAVDVEGDLYSLLALRRRFEGLRLSAGQRARIAIAGASILGRRHLRPPSKPRAEATVHGFSHTRSHDRDAIRHHYDVPTDFYRLVLGPSMVYSCAYFDRESDSLETAQSRKLDLICRKLCLREGDRLLDIGCGWGSLVIHAALRYGVRAVGVTLSESQAEVARGRIRDAGLTDRCEIRVVDYRDVDDGPFDAVASVGMYEHVGLDHLTAYAAKLTSLTAPGGLILNHGITRITPARRDDATFIARFVFPGGELPTIGRLIGSLEEVGFEIRDVESLREHYGLTLRRWVANLQRDIPRAIRTAGAERERIWRLYMSGSALAFENGTLSVFQTVAARPGQRHRLPLSRRTLIGATEKRHRTPGPRPRSRSVTLREQSSVQ